MQEQLEMNSDYYEVEKILDCRVWRYKKYYLVKWKGYSEKDNTWEPLCNLKNVYSLVADFHKDKKKPCSKHERSPLKEAGKGKVGSHLFSYESEEEEEEEEQDDEDEEIKSDQSDIKQVQNKEELSEKQQVLKNDQSPDTAIQPSNIQKEEKINYPELFSKLTNTLPVEQNNNQKMKLLRNQVPIDYLISFYQQTQGINIENYQYENEDSQYPTENFLQKPIVQAILRQIIQFTDQDAQEIAIDHYERTRNRFLGIM